jgi:hypothetical protein
VKCSQARELLSLYLDGELESSRAELLSGHLEVCPGCSRELDELRKALEMLRYLPELTPADGFRAGLKERLAEERLDMPVKCRPRDSLARRWIKLWPRLAVAATLVLAVGITSLWYGLAGPNRNIGLPGTAEQLIGYFAEKDKDIQSRNTKVDDEKRESNGQAAPPGVKDGVAGDSDASGLEIKAPAPETASKEYNREKDTIQATPLSGGTMDAPEATGGPAADAQTTQAPSGAGGPPCALRSIDSGEGGGALLKANTVTSKILHEERIEIEAGDFARLTSLFSSYIPPQEQAAFAESGPKTGRLEIKVPAGEAPVLLQKIKARAGIIRQEEKETDITADYQSLVERLEQLEEKEKWLRAENKTKSTPEMELDNIQNEIQTVRAKLKDMDENLSNVMVQIILK